MLDNRNCPSCGFSLDRDLNASINIHRERTYS
ncbi:zinc ribbon domain-containing protein [Helicobacter heilmannii]